jgi:hypothetical protein
MRTTVSTGLLAISIGVAALTAGQLSPPASWRVRSDSPPDKPIYYVEMPPGWHITTGPGSILHDPAYVAEGRFALEAEIFLFPGTSEEGYGLFTGGKALDGEPAYVAFLLRRDGSASIQSRTGGGTTPVRPWTRHEAIKTGDAKDPVANILRVVAETTEVGFDVNGQRVLSVPRAEVMVDGGFGFRAGPTSTCTSAGST